MEAYFYWQVEHNIHKTQYMSKCMSTNPRVVIFVEQTKTAECSITSHMACKAYRIHTLWCPCPSTGQYAQNCVLMVLGRPKTIKIECFWFCRIWPCRGTWTSYDNTAPCRLAQEAASRHSTYGRQRFSCECAWAAGCSRTGACDVAWAGQQW